MKDIELIAHVKQNVDGRWEKPHLLAGHLAGTSGIAKSFAAKFASGDWGKTLGFFHDAGKGRAEWQRYIRENSGCEYGEGAAVSQTARGKVVHAVQGAVLAEQLFGKGIGRMLAYCIAGHHAGLPDWDGAEGAGPSALQFQQAKIKSVDDLDRSVVAPAVTGKIRPPWQFEEGLDLSLWLRMLFSSLVDADFLDTEKYMDMLRSDSRGGYLSLPALLARLDAFTELMAATSENTPVNAIRRQIQRKCRQMAQEQQGIFSLSVPTGGGKTISSLAFGLEHAKKHGLERVIYVIPFTSIIEQNADVFRSILGDDQVVEHHSNFDDSEATLKSRLAAENWDAPVIVTTAVQFFESLFAAKPGRCRKLHNLAKSVIVLDEAQLVPVEFLAPILEVINLLVKHYQITFVVSTATQPAFEPRNIDGKVFKGLAGVKEIMGDKAAVDALCASLKRVQVELPVELNAVEKWETVAEKLQEHRQVLCIVSDRKSCRELHALMPTGTFHLSALMCGQHRSEMIARIRQTLQDKEPIRVISTQLIEAGVDVDFPVVYRALAGLDSIAQAAGRCNREGRLDGLGRVIVFNAPRRPPVGILRKAAETATGIFRTTGDDLLSGDRFEQYFAELYWKANSLDKADVIRLLNPERKECGIYFRTAAERFRLIDDSHHKTVLVRYGEGESLIERLRSSGPDRRLLRKLQRYAVNIYEFEFRYMRNHGMIEEIWPQVFALTSDAGYSNETGLITDGTGYESDVFII